MLNFKKMHGLGNDFVIFDLRDLPQQELKEQRKLIKKKVVKIAGRHTGIGCDSVILMEPATDKFANFYMRVFNADGTEAGARGNATRCVALIDMEEHNRGHTIVQTEAGTLQCQKEGDNMVKADMGEPKFGWKDIPLSQKQDTLHLDIKINPACKDPVAVNVGNPHCVFFVKELDKIDVAGIGAALENNPLFPERTNIEFVEVKGRDRLRMKVWERGVGVTQACGSGACAVIAAAVSRDLAARKSEIMMDGGKLLMKWREEDGHIIMTGAVTPVFDGVYKDL